MGADEAQIETSFSAASRIAIEQKSISLAKRAEASYAEYRQKRSALRGRFRAKSFDGFVKSRCLPVAKHQDSLGMPRVQLRKIICQITQNDSVVHEFRPPIDLPK